jgi:hypothetical protein
VNATGQHQRNQLFQFSISDEGVPAYYGQVQWLELIDNVENAID